MNCWPGGGGRQRPDRLPATEQGGYVGGLDRPCRRGPGERRTPGRPSAAATGAWRTDRILRWARPGEGFALTRRARLSRPLAITLIPPRDGFADSCRAARRRPNRETSDQTGTGEYTQFRQRIFVLLTRLADRLRNRAGLSWGGSNMTGDSRSFERYRPTAVAGDREKRAFNVRDERGHIHLWLARKGMPV